VKQPVMSVPPIGVIMLAGVLWEVGVKVSAAINDLPPTGMIVLALSSNVVRSRHDGFLRDKQPTAKVDYPSNAKNRQSLELFPPKSRRKESPIP
jgi:hypothetical protein